MDVVPVDPSENWLTPPFAAEEVVENGETYIYGRGSLAEKQSVMGILEAVDFFLHTRGQPRRSIVVAIGHDGERRGMDGARNMAMILFQRNYRFAFVLDNGLAITAGVFPGVPSPLASVGVTEKGYANLQLEISALRPGTSSVPPAETAIGVLAGAVSRLEQNPLPHQFTLGSVEYKRIETAGRSATFWHRLVYANLWLFSPLVVKVILSDFFAAANIRTTTVTTSFNAELKLNEVPPKARAIVNHRLHPDQLFEDVMIHDFSVINDDRIKVRILEFSPSAFISPFGKDVWAYRILVKSILEVFPNVVSVVPGTVLGNSDSFWYLGLSSYIYRFTPCVYKSDDLKRVRGINERISVRNFHQVMDFYFRIIMNAQISGGRPCKVIDGASPRSPLSLDMLLIEDRKDLFRVYGVAKSMPVGRFGVVVLAFPVALLVLVAVVIGRTLTLKEHEWIKELWPLHALELVDRKERSSRIERFKTVLRFPTISYEDEDRPKDAFVPFENMIKYLEQTFPTLHDNDSLVKYERVAEYSLLYTVQGSDRSLLPILLISHTDVVPVDAPENWKAPPFSAEELLAFPLLHNGTYSFVTYETVSNFSRLYTIKGSDPSLHPILLCAHTDVVPVDAPENWDAPPFGADEVVEDGKTYIYGRGAIDDKHAVMGILEATDYFLKERRQPVRGIVIAIGHDEEIRGKHGAGQMAKKLEERSFRFEFILDEGFMVLQGLFPGLADPVALVGISEKGYATVQLTIKSMSSGHSSMPAKETAIGTLSKAIGRLEDQPQPSQFVRDSPEYSMIEALAEHVSFGYRLVYTNLWLFRPIVAMIMGGTPSTAATMRTTSVTTMFHAGVKVNLVPSSASAMLNHRIHPMQSLDSVLAYDRQVIADERITLNVTSYSAPHYISPYGEDVWAYRALSKSILEVFPSVATVVPATLVGNTDTKWYLNLTDTVYRFAPSYFMKDDPKRFHGDNERISVKNFHEAVDFYFRLLLNIQVSESWRRKARSWGSEL
ncbi:unnamed protein product [Cyprideis torosa]|uniref:Peptidase M20 dimerisation domain-containing protein n=1 Tax=Cyprideis torosa TaxID=163714 RepID=A0A7R8ZHM4_9CRUS|nr:unnamed protein product [Cyprideis torosa]CAG0884080.1 unnamed protein product [Cyprideis torosa]